VGLAIFAQKSKGILQTKSGEGIMKILSGHLRVNVKETLKARLLDHSPPPQRLRSYIFTCHMKTAYEQFNQLPMDKVVEMRNVQKFDFLQGMQFSRQKSTVRQICEETVCAAITPCHHVPETS